jgi:alpha-L-fucosidase 2
MRNYLIAIFFLAFCTPAKAQPAANYNLVFDSLAKRWDEGIPLGNGWLGALIWQKESNVRISLDRVDLWDDRPMPKIDKLKFKWVAAQVKKGQYDTVQKLGDEPYEKYPAPSKIPGAALEFDVSTFGKVIRNELDIQSALSTIHFQNGVVFMNYIHATDQAGYFSFENCTDDVIPIIKIPAYHTDKKGTTGNSVEGQGLERLGYAAGTVEKGKNFLRYHQPTWNGNYYEVLVQWIKTGNRILGEWTITQNKKAVLPVINPLLKEPTNWSTHIAWWKDYWSRSAVAVPDAILEKQYYLEMYKFGCVARSNTPPISLQAIWTADNGNLPPWKGDLHHDLNTELSYWPGYTANHLDLTASYTNWLWKVKPENERWTKQCFGTTGLNVPGVTTISGKPMGGWIQYSVSPTTGAWLAQHFYWQWKYSMDEKFLQQRCLPYIKAVENYLSKVRVTDPVSKLYQLPLSSSPEYNDNRIDAWFPKFTNYDLALVKNIYREYIEVLKKTGSNNIAKIKSAAELYPAFDINATGLSIAPGQNLDQSHRHHAHLMAIYPLGLLDIGKEADKNTIDKSLRWLEEKGTREWCGYSFSWAACLYAQARQGDSAAKMLNLFAKYFVSTNSFHLNGDQGGGQYSNFTYRPFTLEGNFAFAQGIHEMLIQSNKGYIEIFPAIPADWKNVSFATLRTEGAFLVSAVKEDGVISRVEISAGATGLMRLKLPFKTFYIEGNKKTYLLNGNVLEIKMTKGEIVVIKNGFE